MTHFLQCRGNGLLTAKSHIGYMGILIQTFLAKSATLIFLSNQLGYVYDVPEAVDFNNGAYIKVS